MSGLLGALAAGAAWAQEHSGPLGPRPAVVESWQLAVDSAHTGSGPAPEHAHVKPHQHSYRHTHWHTHRLEDGALVHHSHPHQHTYWHQGLDVTDQERATRVPSSDEIAPPTDESGRREAGTSFDPVSARSRP